MKYLFLSLFLFISLLMHGQQYRFNHNENIKAIYDFELQHNKEIRETTKGDTIIAVLQFNATGVLAGIKYYDSEKSEGFGKLIAVWPGLDSFIKGLYPFAEVSEYDRELALINSYVFRLPVKKEEIINAVDFITNELPKQEALIKKKVKAKYGEAETGKDIVPNMAFTLTVNKLETDHAASPYKSIKGTLKYLDSGTIRLSADCFLIFKVINTSENGNPQHYIEYKLFKLQKDGSARLYIKQNYVSFNKGKAQIKARGSREYVSDEGDIEQGPESFDFDIQIAFE